MFGLKNVCKQKEWWTSTIGPGEKENEYRDCNKMKIRYFNILYSKSISLVGSNEVLINDPSYC